MAFNEEMFLKINLSRHKCTQHVALQWRLFKRAVR